MTQRATLLHSGVTFAIWKFKLLPENLFALPENDSEAEEGLAPYILLLTDLLPNWNECVITKEYTPWEGAEVRAWLNYRIHAWDQKGVPLFYVQYSEFHLSLLCS